MSATILFARHGHHAEVGKTLSGRSEIALSESGRVEAQRLAARLASVDLSAIHSSPRARARETAAAVAARKGMQVQIVEALDEIDFGAWAGCSFTDLAGDPGWDRWNSQRASARPPGGEDMATATGRALRHIETIEEQEAPVLCVSHCDIIRGVVAHYLGLSADRLLAFDCDPASLTTLALHDGGGRVVTLNERPR